MSSRCGGGLNEPDLRHADEHLCADLHAAGIPLGDPDRHPPMHGRGAATPALGERLIGQEAECERGLEHDTGCASSSGLAPQPSERYYVC